MNPYSVLGVSTQATDQEIKRAYRDLVKRYHPDRRSPEASHEKIAAINQAYDILSDPEKRAQYDRGFASIFYQPPTPQEEDPVEVYKREFKRKRRERERQEEQQELTRNKQIYNATRWANAGVTVFMFVLILKEFFTENTIGFYHAIMCFNSGYVFYLQKYSAGAYRLSIITLFLFAMTLLYLLA